MKTIALVLTTAVVVWLWPAAAQAPVLSSKGLAYRVEGAGEPVVFVHAFSIDHRMWDQQAAALSRGFTVIRYDQRGHGASVAPMELPHAWASPCPLVATMAGFFNRIVSKSSQNSRNANFIKPL